MKSSQAKFSRLLIALLAAVFIAGCTNQAANKLDEAAEAPSASPVAQEPAEGDQPSQTSFEFTSAQDGQTAFELLEEQAEIEYEQTDFGAFITGINGVDAGSSHFWAIYLNGEMAQVGASDLVLQEGDQVEFRLEEIQF